MKGEGRGWEGKIRGGEICFTLFSLWLRQWLLMQYYIGCICHTKLFFIVTAAADPTYETTDMSPEEVRPVYTELVL